MPKRTMPVRKARIELDGDYKDWWVEIRTNPPVGLLLDTITKFQKAQAETPEDIEAVMPPIFNMLNLVLISWNFVDEKGKDLPANQGGLKQIPLELLFTLASQVQEGIVGLPLASSGKPSSRS